MGKTRSGAEVYVVHRGLKAGGRLIKQSLVPTNGKVNKGKMSLFKRSTVLRAWGQNFAGPLFCALAWGS